jgi:uncharacterized protein involved in exopolysaccharide biosynthesis
MQPPRGDIRPRAALEENSRVYLVPADFATGDGRGDIDLVKLITAAWKQRWWVVATTGITAMIAVAYVLIATEWYRAEVTLAPADDGSASSLSGQFGGLVSLAGISVGSDGLAEPIAILKSRKFARSFIEEMKLLPVLLYEEWDAESNSWKAKNPDDWPDIRDALKVFDEEVRQVSEDTKTGMVTLQINWTDPELAAEWANQLVGRLNTSMRDRALVEAEGNIRYLQSQLTSTNVLALQQSIGRLLEAEMQKLMLARGNDEYAFRVIDPAIPPKERFKPRRTLVVALVAMLGLMASSMVVLVLAVVRNNARDNATGAAS